MIKHRNIILNIRFHVGEEYSYSSKDFEYYELFKSPQFGEIRTCINDMDKNDHYIDNTSSRVHLTHYYSDDKIFIICGYVKKCSEKLIKLRKESNYEYQSYARELYKDYVDRLTKRNEKIDKDAGYVNYSSMMYKPLNLLIGNLPKKIIMDNLDYLGSGIPCGYFGHGCRQFWMDDVIAEVYNDAIKNKQKDYAKRISMFLNHSNARHWMDSVEHLTVEDREIFKQKFTATINGLILTIEEK